MSRDPHPPEDTLQQRFEEAAANLRPAAGRAPSEVEPRCVGAAFAFFSRTVDVETEGSGAPLDDTEKATISEHLTAWEGLAPQAFAKQWRSFATDPYVGVGPTWVGTVDDKAISEWQASDQLAEAMKTHPPYSPRKVTLSSLLLTQLGPGRVLATYRVEETYQNGKLSAGNTFAVLMRVKGQGWRIAVASKGTRHEAALRG